MPDPRSAAQRRHDALGEIFARVLRGPLPTTGGVPTTVLVRVTLNDLPAGALDPHQLTWNGAPTLIDAATAHLTDHLRTTRENATTSDHGSGHNGSGHNGSGHNGSGHNGDHGSGGHGGNSSSGDRGDAPGGFGLTAHDGLLSTRRLKTELCTAELDVLVTNPAGAVLAFGRSTRLGTRPQRLALAGRDGGCSFPGCTRPPAWCEAHHIRESHSGGATDLTNLTLLCSYHHRHFERLGWSVHMHHGVPQWTPPPWIDPQQRPRRNTARHLLDHELPRLRR